MISDRKQYIGIKNNIVFELFQFLFMLEWFLACISRFSAHIPTSFSVFMPNICCLDKLDNKHYAYRLIMMWEYGQKNEKYWPGSIPAHIRIGKVLNVVIFDTNNCLIPSYIIKETQTFVCQHDLFLKRIQAHSFGRDTDIHTYQKCTFPNDMSVAKSSIRRRSLVYAGIL